MWNHTIGRYERAAVARVAHTAEEFAAATLSLHRDASAWREIAGNAARFARSGGGGKGVCRDGLVADLASFWEKLDRGTCRTTA